MWARGHITPLEELGAWDRAALRVALLAAEIGVPLDSEELIFCDVHDLQALRLRLSRHRGKSSLQHGERGGPGRMVAGALPRRVWRHARSRWAR